LSEEQLEGFLNPTITRTSLNLRDRAVDSARKTKADKKAKAAAKQAQEDDINKQKKIGFSSNKKPVRRYEAHKRMKESRNVVDVREKERVAAVEALEKLN
jgi:hypothetical protein